MRHYKTMDSGYIISIGIGNGGTEITESEYSKILSVIRSRPADPDGYTYKLRADTREWELVELPPEPEEEPDLSAEEALDIIMGGAE